MFSLWYARLQLSTYTTSWTPFLSDPSLKPKTNLKKIHFLIRFHTFPIEPVRISCPTNLGGFFAQKRNQTHHTSHHHLKNRYCTLRWWNGQLLRWKSYELWRSSPPLGRCGGWFSHVRWWRFFLYTAWRCGLGGTTKPNWVCFVLACRNPALKKKKVGGLIWDLGEFCVVSHMFPLFLFLVFWGGDWKRNWEKWRMDEWGWEVR